MATADRKAVRAIMPDLLAGIKAAGIQVKELSEAEKAEFEKAALPVRKVFRKQQGKKASDLLDLAEKALAEYRKKK